MAYVKVVGGVVVQKSCLPENGFIEAGDDVVCGMLQSGSVFATPQKSSADNAAEKAKVLEEAREMRSEILNALEGIKSNDISPTDTVSLAAIAVARQSLKDLPIDPAVVAAVTAAETHAAVMAVWKTISTNLALVSPTAAKAFRNVAKW